MSEMILNMPYSNQTLIKTNCFLFHYLIYNQKQTSLLNKNTIKSNSARCTSNFCAKTKLESLPKRKSCYF